MDDAQILSQITHGEERGLEAAINQYAPLVASVIRSKSGQSLSSMDVEELTSDVFVSLWQGASAITSNNLKAWLCRVARNKTVDLLRKPQLEAPFEEQLLYVDESTWNRLELAERQQTVQQAMAQLEPQTRELFYRHYILGQSSREIGQHFGLNAATVRSQLFRGRKVLRKYFTEGGYLCANEI